MAIKSPLIGKTVRELHFRSRYNAAVVAVHRDGTRMPLRVQDIVLEVGQLHVGRTHVLMPLLVQGTCSDRPGGGGGRGV